MKKLLISLGLSMAACVLGSSAGAQVITSVQFKGYYRQYNAPAEDTTVNGSSAGVLPETVWNNDPGAGSGTGLSNLQSSAGATTIGETTVSSYASYYNTPPAYNTGFTSLSGDQKLASSGFLVNSTSTLGSSLTLNLSGLSPTDTYNLYLYTTSTQSYLNPLVEVQTGGQDGATPTYYYRQIENETSYVQATSTSSSTTSTADYVEFTGLTGSSILSLTISTGAPSGQTVNVSGFQLDDLGAGGSSVPEPSTWALMLTGLGFLVWRFRTRRA
jgi:hypothetical protein